jgi:acetyl-CoA carboxylase carboxyl transferase subunit beta
MGISPRARMEALFDGGIFVEVDVPKPITDPLHFRDQKNIPTE